MHTAVLMSFNPLSLVNEDQSFPFSSGVCLKAGRVCMFIFFFQRRIVLSTLPQHFSSNCNTEVSLEKAQGATAQHEHMAQGPAHKPPRHHRSVLICCDEFSTMDSVFIHFKVEKCARTEDEEPGIKHRREKMPKMRQ